MSVWSTLDRGTRVLILSAGGAVLAGAGFVGWQLTRPEPLTVAEDAVAVAEPDAEPTVSSTAEPAPVAESPTVVPLPKIDTWRVAANGEAVVAGKAEPGAKVDVLVDSVVVASGVAGTGGDFALLFTLAANPEPSLMWLEMTAAEGKPVPSAEMVALGPIAGPPVVLAGEETPPEVSTEPAELAATEDPAPEAPPALLLSESGAVVLQEAAPEAPEAAEARVNVMIDTIAYTPDGEVQVGGRGKAGAPLRLYLDNTERVTLTVPETGLWLTPLPGTEPGIYTLRVDQLDATGKVISRFETPFKRETLEALAAASAIPAETAPPALAAAEVAEPVVEPPEPVAEPVAETAPVAEAEPTAEASAEAASESAPEPVAAEPVTPAPEITEPVAQNPDPALPEVAVAEGAPATPPTVELAAEPAPELPAPTADQPEPVALAEAPPKPVTVTVQPGFTLWGIAQERWGDGVYYVQVFEANKDKIKNPDLIYPGQVFAMPEPAAP